MAKIKLSERIANYFVVRAEMAERDSAYRADTKYMSANEIYNYGISDTQIDMKNPTSLGAKANMGIAKMFSEKVRRDYSNKQKPVMSIFPNQGMTLVDKTGVVHNYQTGATYLKPQDNLQQSVNYERKRQTPVSSRPQASSLQHRDVRMIMSRELPLPTFDSIGAARQFADYLYDTSRNNINNEHSREYEAFNHALTFMDEMKANPQAAMSNQKARVDADKYKIEQAYNKRAIANCYKDGTLPVISSGKQALAFTKAITQHAKARVGVIDPDKAARLDRQEEVMMEHVTQYLNDLNSTGNPVEAKNYADRKAAERIADHNRDMMLTRDAKIVGSPVFVRHPKVASAQTSVRQQAPTVFPSPMPGMPGLQSSVASAVVAKTNTPVSYEQKMQQANRMLDSVQTDVEAGFDKGF